MENTTNQPAQPATAAARNLQYPPLELETRRYVETACAAYHLNRQPQTLRSWASTERGALRPIRINGRLAWPTAEIKRLLGAV